MKKFIVEGGNLLTGNIKISGAKNSAVALLPAAILSDDFSTIYNVPSISDTHNLIHILELLGCEIKFMDDTLVINSKNLENKVIEEQEACKLRASYYFMGSILAKFKKVEMFFPGGCNIGSRPIDIHLKGFEKLGAKVTTQGNKYLIEAEELIGANIYLDFASVGATINLMIASTKAKGITIIENAAKEPEIVNVATFLNNMGAKITGAGTSTIKIEGVTSLSNGIVENIPDRIEAGTYIIIGALAGKDLVIEGVIKEHLDALLSKLKEMGVNFTILGNSVKISKGENLKAVNIKTLVYPGFPTDLGQPVSVLLTQCNGTSLFEETIFENRQGHVPYLNKMGANISPSGQNLIVKGKTQLNGTDVSSTDLRAGASMICAALVANGKTTIEEIEHILRGYENIVEKLQQVGAKIIIEEKV
ncbi:MAG: UDP-N-acetylglucosamine 1-carboxyvinyltransferase [Mollicutes bacterium]|jgi:UDP-N-acetylglucosamine 1-carboxyvinyltransferase|nr:UDP-N-acetylglucosamine 1-carboxyvinyltransferase [Mollicutes bacterium]